MQMIFQDPYASLNPRKCVGQILEDPFRIHHEVDRGTGPSDELFLRPVHPYTQALLSAIPAIDGDEDDVRRERIVLEGEVPGPVAPPSGCRFHPRCRYATDICKVGRPPLADHGGGRFAACHHPLDEKGDAA